MFDSSQMLDAEHLQIQRQDFSVVLGTGINSVVIRGTYHKLNVAIKIPKKMRKLADIKKLFQEAALLR